MSAGAAIIDPMDPKPPADPWGALAPDASVVPEAPLDERGDETADTVSPLCRPALDDAALVQLVRRIVYQDEAAFAALYRQLSGSVYALVLRITREIGSAEEVVEDVFWQLWRQAPRYDAERGTVVAWVRRIARSRALDALRAQLSNPLRGAAELDDDESAAFGDDRDADDPLQRLAGVRNAGQLEQALAALDPLRRQLVSLAFLRGCSQAEIAEQTGLPLGTVKSHIRRALAAMKTTIEGANAPTVLTRGRA
jgi:RNA polymerase sigma factor (sigma-70 family)